MLITPSNFFRLCIFTFIFYYVSVLLASKPTVAIVFDKSNASYNFAAAEMKKDIEGAGFVVSIEDIKNLSDTKANSRIILTCRNTDECNAFMKLSGVTFLPSSVPQGYSIRQKPYNNHTDWFIIGFDKIGAMYGGLDAGKLIRIYGFNGLKEQDKKPYITNRGIKFNIPLDARTPSYSDNSDIAQRNIEVMWDKNFWHSFIDDMAKDHLNMLSLWSLAPFPSLVNVPEYPKAGLNDVKKTAAPITVIRSLMGLDMVNPEVLKKLITVKTITLQQKIKFWQDVMQYADERGVNFYLFVWNIFTYGTEDSGYGFTDKLTDTKTKDYFRKATKALVATYPLLKGLGITTGENMQKGTAEEKEAYLYDTYGQGINDALSLDTSRTFYLIHRAHMSDIKLIKSEFAGLNRRCALDFSYKYSQAHVYSSTKPDYIKTDNVLDDLGNSKFFFTVRDDDWYFLRGGSDPAFTRAYIKNMPTNNFNGFYLGPDGYIWGRQCISKNPKFNDQTIYNKRWYSFNLWGSLAYDPDIPDSLFKNSLRSHYPKINSKNLFKAWALASQVVPLVNRFHNSDCQLDFQWYPEACYSLFGFHSIDKFINTNPQSGEGLMSIKEYAAFILKDSTAAGTTPVELAANLLHVSNDALSLIKSMTSSDEELAQTLEDIKAMANLGQYYSKKILGATNKYLSIKAADQDKKLKYKNEAIKNLQEASICWKNYAGIISRIYKPQYLNRMLHVIDMEAIQTDVDNDISIAMKEK